MLSADIQQRLIEHLKCVDPEKVILFGSHAYGKAGPDSDIDLLVVTQDEFLPRDFSEKNAIYLRVSEALTEIEKQIPIDLIVHTKVMHQRFIDMGGMFSRKVLSEGEVLYEKTH